MPLLSLGDIYNRGSLVKSKSFKVKDLQVSSGSCQYYLWEQGEATSQNLHFLIYEMVLSRVRMKRKENVLEIHVKIV